MASPGRPPSTTTTTTTPSRPPPLALLVYPITLLIGSLYSTISPTARGSRTSDQSHHQHPAPLAPSIATDVHLSLSPSETAVNYFARKDNIFNLYFVKIGWVWFTLAFVALLVSQTAYYRTPNSSAATGRKRSIQAGVRYVLATTVWYLMTHWFFGPAVIDRSFVITGGKCERIVSAVTPPTSGGGGENDGKLEKMLTAAACKAAGGSWTGGHDVSGHVFMLVLATGVLAFEVLGVVGIDGLRTSLMCGGDAEGFKEKDGDDAPASTAGGSGNDDAGASEGHGLKVWALRFVVAVAGMGWWMLFMTAIWFHTWLEKVFCLSLQFFFFMIWFADFVTSGLDYQLPWARCTSFTSFREKFLRGGISWAFLVFNQYSILGLFKGLVCCTC